MKILIICSKAFYKDIVPIKEKLEKMGHTVELPNSYYEPDAEKKSWDLGQKEHAELSDAIFVVNVGGYIGKSTSEEIAYAKEKGKEIIYLENIGGKN